MRRLIVPIACVLMLAAAVSAFATDPPLTDDAYTSLAKPTTNFGSGTYLQVDNQDDAYLKFDLSTLPAGIQANQVSKATLRLFVNHLTTPGLVDLYQVGGAWSEGGASGITYNFAPTSSGPMGTPYMVSTVNSWVVMDVTSVVQAWLSGTPNYGLRIAAPASGVSVLFDSKESTSTSHAPELQVELSGPAGPAGATGQQGPTGATGAQGPAGPNTLASGVVTAPSLKFAADLSTGLFLVGPHAMAVASGGMDRMQFRADGDIDISGNIRQLGEPFLYAFGGGNLTVGPTSMPLTATGVLNTAMGVGVLHSLTTGELNTAVGNSALQLNSDGFANTAVGADALAANTHASQNTAVGSGALSNNTTGYQNSTLGYLTLNASSTGNNNAVLGAYALQNSVSGSNNLAVGVGALQNLTSGDNNTAIGFTAGVNLATGSNNIDIANPGTPTDSGVLRIGQDGVQSATFIASIRGVTTGQPNAIPVYIDSNGQLGTVSSSRRFKEDIRDMGSVSDRLMRLRPVTYRYIQKRDDGSQPIEYGLIAEEVEEVYPDLVAHSADGRIETVQYQKIEPLLLNEVQKQRRALEAQAQEIRGLQEQVERLLRAASVK
ncbi:exported hypothetical protein [Candidatus Sulfopaludibacter sp. SbA3]|nr:exported hypothetical protein [Candidatus Sulfopaludibacter sp. SbA3]